MKRRIVTLLLVVALVLGAVLTITATKDDNVSITINGETVEFSDASGRPFVDETGRTQVPLRVVMEAYGCAVEWDEESNTAVISKGDTVVEVPIGERHIVVDGKKKGIDTAAVVRDGRTYLPIRAVLEAFGADVDWENNEVRVSSSAVDAFENIYIDDHGDLIFELANGNEINAGNVEGSNGRSGVSVKDAYVDATGELMIVLSNGRTIDAGNVGVGGSMSGMTFADYPIGTKFYLSHPTGKFEVPVKGESGEEYTVRFDEIYYELIAKRDFGSEEGWKYESNATPRYENISTEYIPYEVTVHVSGKTSEELSGTEISVRLYEPTSGTNWEYSGDIAEDGSFAIEVVQGESATGWYVPKELFFREINIQKSIVQEEEPEEPEYTQEELIAMVVGDWALSPTEKITVAEDGTMTINGTAYTPTYEQGGKKYVYAVAGDIEVQFPVDGEIAKYEGERYYKGRTWEAVTLTKDNFFTYFEYLEELEIDTNAFGEFEDASLECSYVLKNEYQEAVYYSGSVGIKVKQTAYNNCEYALDKEEKICTIETWGEKGTTIIKARDFDTRTYEITLAAYWLSEVGATTFYQFEPIEFTGTLYFVNK